VSAFSEKLGGYPEIKLNSQFAPRGIFYLNSPELSNRTLDNDMGIKPIVERFAKNAYESLSKFGLSFMGAGITNLYIPVYVPLTTQVTFDGSTVCQDICGFHDEVTVSDIPGIPTVQYGVIPILDDSVSKTSCLPCRKAGLTGLQNMQLISTHELAEGILAQALGNNYDENYPDIADGCNWITNNFVDLNGVEFTIQKVIDFDVEDCV
jgi:hypothetical protein